MEAESLIYIQRLDANGDPSGRIIQLTVFSKGGDGSDASGFASDGGLRSGVQYVKVDGNNVGSASYSEFVVCFAPGTPIRTPGGLSAVERLAPDDRV